MQSACAIETVPKADEKENVDLDNFKVMDWLRSPDERRVGVKIVECPSEKKVHVQWPAYADNEENRWIFFAELCSAHDYWLRELRKKSPKALRRIYVAPMAKERARLIGTCLLDLCREKGFLPLTQSLRVYITNQAHAFAEKRWKAARTVQLRPFRSGPHVWAARRTLPHISEEELHTWSTLEREDYQDRADFEATIAPRLTFTSRRPSLCATYADLAAQVKPGERKTDVTNHKEVARSENGEAICVTDQFGVQRILTGSTMERDSWSVTVVEAKYSKPVRFTSRDGNVVYSDTERETLFEPVTVEHVGNLKPVTGVQDLVPEITPTTALLTDHEKKRREKLGLRDETDVPTAPTVPNRIRVKTEQHTYEPNACVGTLGFNALRTILYNKVRMGNGSFTIGEKTYPTADYRISKDKIDVTSYVGMRGQLASPYLNAIASKLSYLQRVSPEANDCNTLLEKRLPWLLANIDAFDETRPARSPAAQHLREQAIAEAV